MRITKKQQKKRMSVGEGVTGAGSGDIWAETQGHGRMIEDVRGQVSGRSQEARMLEQGRQAWEGQDGAACRAGSSLLVITRVCSKEDRYWSHPNSLVQRLLPCGGQTAPGRASESVQVRNTQQLSNGLMGRWATKYCLIPHLLDREGGNYGSDPKKEVMNDSGVQPFIFNELVKWWSSQQ